MAWISFGALQAKKKTTWWQLASRCCWNRARLWHAFELVSFLVGLRTYQHPATSLVIMESKFNYPVCSNCCQLILRYCTYVSDMIPELCGVILILSFSVALGICAISSLKVFHSVQNSLLVSLLCTAWKKIVLFCRFYVISTFTSVNFHDMRLSGWGDEWCGPDSYVQLMEGLHSVSSLPDMLCKQPSHA